MEPFGQTVQEVTDEVRTVHREAAHRDHIYLTSFSRMRVDLAAEVWYPYIFYLCD